METPSTSRTIFMRRQDPVLNTQRGPEKSIKILLFAYFAICMFMNVVIREDVFLTTANLAEFVLMPIALLLWLRKPHVRAWRGSKAERNLVVAVVAYLIVRILCSFHTEYFLRLSSKLFILVALVICYHLLDMERRLFGFMSWLLPSFYAFAVAIGLAIQLANGTLGANRLEIPLYSHEYVGGMAGFLFGFLIYRWSRQRADWRVLPLLAISILLLLGLFLSAARGALLDAVATLVCYLLFYSYSWKRRIVVFAGLFLTVSSVAWVYTLGSQQTATANLQSNRLDVTQDATALARVLIWKNTWDQLTSSPKLAIFGFGLGGFTADVPEAAASGKYDWDSIKTATFNGFLGAWASLGVFGLFGYGLMVYCFFRRVRAIPDRKHRALLLGMLIGMLLNDMVNEHWMQTRYNWLVAYMVSLFAFSTDVPPESSSSSHQLRWSNWWFRIVVPYRNVFTTNPDMPDHS